ncbi:unnamed protein product, partial [Closterium sp. Naga37s-1]
VEGVGARRCRAVQEGAAGNARSGMVTADRYGTGTTLFPGSSLHNCQRAAARPDPRPSEPARGSSDPKPHHRRIRGALVLMSLLSCLAAMGLKRGVTAMCIGGGSATAVVVGREEGFQLEGHRPGHW